jgi:hypothetical protein
VHGAAARSVEDREPSGGFMEALPAGVLQP